MKTITKFPLIFLAVAAIVAGCVRNSDIDDLQRQIDELKSGRIQTVEGQISSILTSITSLQSTDEALQNYISTLQIQTAELEKTDADLSAAISSLKTELSSRIDIAEADCLARLEAYKETVRTQMTSLNESIGILQSKDSDLQKQIDSLRSYVDSGIKATRDWASATFATIDQYTTTADIVADVQSRIESINSDIDGMKSYISGLKEDLDAAISGLRSELQAEIKSAADNAATALETAIDEISAAYKSAIADAVAASEKSLKSWVKEQLLDGYYTAAQMDSKLDALRTSLEGQLGSQKTYLESLITSLELSVSDKIATNLSLIEQLRSDLSATQGDLSAAEYDIKANASAIADNATAIANNTVGITANTESIRVNADEINTIKTQISTLESEMDSSLSALERKLTAAEGKTQADIEAIKGDIEAIKSDYSSKIAALQTSLEAKISANTDLINANKSAISANSTLISNNSDLISANKTAIETLKTSAEASISANSENIAANTENIATNASDIAKNAGLIATNAAAISGNEQAIANNAADIAQLRLDLAAQKIEIEGAYKTAIETAVNTLDGKLTEEITAEVNTLNGRIDSEVQTINATITSLTNRVSECEGDIKDIQDSIASILQDIKDLKDQINALLSRVQSVTYIPKYADGIERVEYDESTATATDLTIRFDIRPADCADSIVLAYSKYLQNTTLASPLKARAVYTLTKAAAAGDFVDLTIKSVTAEKDQSTNKSTGVLSVTISPTDLCNEFFQGTLGASLVLSVSTGYSDIQSDYIRLAVSRVENSSSAEYYSTIPFTITSVGATSVALSRYVGWTETNTDVNINLQYRKNSGGWMTYTVGGIISLADTDVLQFRSRTSAGNSTFSSGKYYYKFKVGGEGKIIASGNAMSLLNKNLSVTKAPERCFYALFYDVENLVSAANLQLPATELSAYCYANMFDGCTALVSAPKLPATKLADYCYSQMFESTALVRAPALPAKRLAERCYYRMFYRCTSLTAAPSELPALDLASWTHCYLSMFQGCTALTSAPKLPATKLSQSCYYSMFEGCTSLTAAPELNATTLADYCYKRMFYGCTSLTAAPELPAATLVTQCYRNMFYGCKNLNYVQAMFTNSPSYIWEDDGSTVWYTYGWLDGVAKEGTFVKNADATWDATGANAIPSGWTVLTE